MARPSIANSAYGIHGNTTFTHTHPTLLNLDTEFLFWGRVQAGNAGPAEWTMGMGASMCLEAKPGSVVLFPAWLDHYVLTHNSDEPRLSISFNVKVPPRYHHLVLNLGPSFFYNLTSGCVQCVFPGHHPTASDVPKDHGLHVHIPQRHRDANTP